ncbi:hypothetical protein [Streptomyces sp. 4F14]|uniref:hypothetical protein n=1 Tax=Streptomyces sp. 4F14 TaxID=3394380 RepID=UPI003A887299
MAEAAKTSDWKSPLLGRYATGDALSAISRGLYADHRNGLVARGGPKNYPKVTSATPVGNPAVVMVSDCGDSTNWLRYRKETGERAENETGGRRAITAEVVKQSSDFWKVTWFEVKELGSC